MKKYIKKLAELCGMEASNFAFAFVMSVIVTILLITFAVNY
jgi:hypothetical protein